MLRVQGSQSLSLARCWIWLVYEDVIRLAVGADRSRHASASAIRSRARALVSADVESAHDCSSVDHLTYRHTERTISVRLDNVCQAHTKHDLHALAVTTAFSLRLRFVFQAL